MQFDLDDERAQLKQATRELLEGESPLAESRALMEQSAEGFSKALYAQLAELGYLGLLLPEDAGGAGVGHVGLAAVLEEMGRVAFPGPFLDQILAIETLRRCPGDEARRWLERALGGDVLVVLARAETLSLDEPAQPETRLADARIVGRKRWVPFGAQADALLVTTDQGLALVPRPDSGWNATPLETIDLAQRFAEIPLAAPGSALLGPAATDAALAEVDRTGALAAAALLLGVMERSLELTRDYTVERQAFGAPIASFQALQHRMADMLIQTEGTRAAVYRAAWATDAEDADAARLVAVAKAQAGDASRFVCGETIQLHGGVGYTWEYDPHIYYKRAKTLEQFYGSTRDALEQLLEASGI